MRSQKQTNKAPRPHKATSSARGWSGGPAGFIPAPKFSLKARKPAAEPEPPAPDMATPGKAAPPEASQEKENRPAAP